MAVPAWLSLAMAAVPLALLGSGLLATLLPDALLRPLCGGRDPLALAMLPFALGLALLGLLLAAMHGTDAVRAGQTWQWQPVPARIVRSDLVEVMQPRSSRPGWRPEVRYEYRHAGQTRTGHRIALRPLTSSDRDGTDDWLRRTYPAGADLTAYVNPAAPAQAVLERGGSHWTWWLCGTGLVLLGCGLWLLRTAVRECRMPPAKPAARRRSRRRKPHP
ncbi:DUF3592 domain-containing protein [Pseudoxanthomonas broegbernensis]|nr:DUF3592 domain-containing protein [Pseudoxanthomonas broegbernensis]